GPAGQAARHGRGRGSESPRVGRRDRRRPHTAHGARRRRVCRACRSRHERTAENCPRRRAGQCGRVPHGEIRHHGDARPRRRRPHGGNGAPARSHARGHLVMRRGWIVALGIVAVAAACSNGTEPKVTASNPLADSADQVMFGVSTMITDQGLLRAKLQADTAYFFDGSTRIEARNEKTTFYTATGVENAVLTSQEGTYNSARGTMQARKNVVVVTTDNKRLETPLLDYNQQTNLISSDSAFVLTQPTGIMRGIGFTSDPNMTNLHVKRVITGGGTFTLPSSGTSP